MGVRKFRRFHSFESGNLNGEARFEADYDCLLERLIQKRFSMKDFSIIGTLDFWIKGKHINWAENA